MTIWKFPLALDPGTEAIKLPAGAEVLTVQMQCGIPVLWARVDPEAEPADFAIECVFTGGRSHSAGRYVGTVQVQGLVYHYFVR